MAKRAGLTGAECMTRVAAIFDRHGWPLEIDLLPTMLSGVESGAALEAGCLARRVPTDYLLRNRVERASIRAALYELDGVVVGSTGG